MVDRDKVVESYKNFLKEKYLKNYKPFCNRLTDSPEGGRAEAFVFSFLQGAGDHPVLEENFDTGGPDFCCSKGDVDFIVEVTSLGKEAVAKNSGLPNEIPEGGCGGTWGLKEVTHMLRTRVSKKVRQLSEYEMPRVLAVTCEHRDAADSLLGIWSAEELFSSNTMLSIPIDYRDNEMRSEEETLVTDLKNSVFFRNKNGVVESCRRSVSAILLISILFDKVSVVGILHPDPQHVFPVDILPPIPFLRMVKWPPEQGKIEMEWTISESKPAQFYYHEVT